MEFGSAICKANTQTLPNGSSPSDFSDSTLLLLTAKLRGALGLSLGVAWAAWPGVCEGSQVLLPRPRPALLAGQGGRTPSSQALWQPHRPVPHIRARTIAAGEAACKVRLEIHQSMCALAAGCLWTWASCPVCPLESLSLSN